VKTLNNRPTCEFEQKDRCPSCGSFCNIFEDLDEKDYCNDCRPKKLKNNLLKFMGKEFKIDFSRQNLKSNDFKSKHSWNNIIKIRVYKIDFIKLKAEIYSIEKPEQRLIVPTYFLEKLIIEQP
jgi:hypothetical protein